MHLETRVLITGGAGFLGSHLCERLLREDAKVLCVDNFFTGARRRPEENDRLFRGAAAGAGTTGGAGGGEGLNEPTLVASGDDPGNGNNPAEAKLLKPRVE
jgi:nucleoside-diphosphate-sugar epimerase